MKPFTKGGEKRSRPHEGVNQIGVVLCGGYSLLVWFHCLWWSVRFLVGRVLLPDGGAVTSVESVSPMRRVPATGVDTYDSLHHGTLATGFLLEVWAIGATGSAGALQAQGRRFEPYIAHRSRESSQQRWSSTREAMPTGAGNGPAGRGWHHADVAQRLSDSLPSCRYGFDSRLPLVVGVAGAACLPSGSAGR